jgi:hypothetical protein
MNGQAANPTITPANDGPGNAAYQSMSDLLAQVTARERGQG